MRCASSLWRRARCSAAARIADAVVLTRETHGGVPRTTSDVAKLVSAARCGAFGGARTSSRHSVTRATHLY